MRYLMALILCFCFGQNVYASESGGAQFKGAVALQVTLQARLFEPGNTFDAANYFGTGFNLSDNYVPEIMQLLGVYDANGTSSEFINGTPNPVNMMIHDVLFSGFAKDASAICQKPEVIYFSGMDRGPLKKAVYEQLYGLCGSRSEEAYGDNLVDLWLTFMGYSAPEEEFTAWQDYLMSAEFAQASGPQMVESALYTLLNNPYFLLRR